MKRKYKIMIGAGIVILTVAGIGAAVFAPHIREISSVAHSATLDQQQVESMEEERSRFDQNLRERFNITDDDETADNTDTSGNDASVTDNAESVPDNAEVVPDNAESVGPADSTESAESGTPAQNEPVPTEPPREDPVSTEPVQDEPVPTQPPVPTEAPAVPTQAPTESAAPTSTPAPVQQAAPTSAPPTVTPTPEMSEDEQKLQSLVQEMYNLRKSFSNRVESIVSECVQEFLALDPAEQTTMNKMRIVSARLGEVADMEDECDNDVNHIVSQIQEIDPELAAEVKQQYENEKALKKAELVARYSGG